MVLQKAIETDGGSTITTNQSAVVTVGSETTLTSVSKKTYNLEDFKADAETITLQRAAVKTQMDDLAKNIYTSIHQLNFSTKLITDANYFLTKYIDTETSLYSKLNYALTTANIETTINLYDNITFNSLFIKSMVYFGNFAKILMEAVSYYYVVDGISELSLKAIHELFCKAMSIKNE